ncbi:hypothetical protein SAMN05421721_1244 [Ectothiorhodospira mobilis]|uniref:4-amino-4-deoxy-L-arabinose transferase n=1 Tax=Ectothiorhodospira mobilis TaxID=195064 RepID=A0A1I4SXS2_ECTMO|nr:DUF6311 domain-containing protein [Ectothiorhodospira mobilis]SFM69113.1 hypothetical protein SAMN05421721_1244 [Ectothiorhodospira mobilis]
MSSNQSKIILAVGLASVMGLLFALSIYGFDRLNPLNYGWLMIGDAATHFLGWHFYRSEPTQWPLGLIDRYGMESSSSIVYTDSIPLFAMLLKPISAYLPEIFQYTGLWIAISYMLQGGLGALLVSRFTSNPLVIVLGSLFFVLSSIMAFRGGGHYALMGHWLILAGILLYRRTPLHWSGLSWGILASIAALVHAYLAVMVMALMAADLLSRWFKPNWIRWQAIALQMSIVFSILLFSMWVAGYFTAGSVAGGGSTLYSMNLLAPLMPTPSTDAGFIPHHKPATWGQYEGFNYLGLGTLLLLIFGLPRLWRLWKIERGHIQPYFPLFIAAALLAMYALSPMVTLGKHTLIHVPPLTNFTDVFRATGRMFWPAFYLLTLLSIVLTIRRRPAWIAAPILALALVIQWLDLSPLYKDRVSNQPFSTTYTSSLTSPFWPEAADVYHHVIVIPPTFTVENFIPLSHYAAMQDMAINIAYYGRPPSEKALRQKQERINRLMAGELDPHALYVFREYSELKKVLPKLDRHDAYGLIDQHWVLAPDAFTHGLDQYASTLTRP